MCKQKSQVIFGWFLTAIFLLACGLFSAPTKTSANPLLTLLAGIPQDPISASKGEIYFMDAAAMEAAYNITRPPNAEVFMNEEYAAWWVVGRETLGLLGETLFQMETMPEMTGFSPLEIDQAIQFSAPPSQGLIFMGKFDADAIEDAFEKNLDFKPNDFNGTTLWCWIEGCENGMQIDPGNALRENPFGGRLGQRQPMIISSDLLMASPDLDLVLAHVSARKGKLSSLADDPAYHAAANAVSKDAYVLQAMIVNRTRLQQMVNNPPYDLLVMADVVAKDEQITRLGLVYRDIDSPEMVASALLERLASRQSAQFKRRFAELLTARNVTSPRHFIYQEADRTVVVLEFPTRKATLDELAQMVNIITYEGNATPPGLVYRLFFQTFGMEDIGWLSPATQAELEAIQIGKLVGFEVSMNLSEIGKDVIDKVHFGGIVIVELDDGTIVKAVWDKRLGEQIVGGMKLEVVPSSDPDFWEVIRIVEMP
jgi:hypothetical protein